MTAPARCSDNDVADLAGGDQRNVARQLQHARGTLGGEHTRAAAATAPYDRRARRAVRIRAP